MVGSFRSLWDSGGRFSRAFGFLFAFSGDMIFCFRHFHKRIQCFLQLFGSFVDILLFGKNTVSVLCIGGNAEILCDIEAYL